MSEYYVYRPNGDCLGVIKKEASIQWHQYFDKSGKFEIHLMDPNYKAMYFKNNIIVCNDDLSMGFIESIECVKKEVIVRGHLDNLDDFLNVNTFNLKNVNQLIPLANANVRGRNLYPQPTDIDIPIQAETTWKTLRDTFNEQCFLNQCGYSMRYDEETNHYNLMIHKARFNDGVSFDDDGLGNIIIERFLEDISKEKNYAYVAGEGEGSARKIVEVDISNGQHKKEMYVDAREIRKTYTGPDHKEHTYTDEEYTSLLRNKGLAKLAERGTEYDIDVDVDETSEIFKFEKDYTRGDIVLVTSKKLDFKGYFLVSESKKVKQIYEKTQVVFRYLGGVEYGTMLSTR